MAVTRKSLAMAKNFKIQLGGRVFIDRLFDRRDFFSLALLLLSFSFVSSPTLALELQYGGRLAGPSGEPIAGPVDITFRFYRLSSGAEILVSVPVSNVVLVDGLFQATIPLSAEDTERLFEDGDQSVFIEVEAQGRIYPRQKFSYVPLALRVPVDGTKIIYDSQGRLTLGGAATSSVGLLSGVTGTGGVEKTGDQTYGTFALSPLGKSLIGASSTAAQRTILGLGTMAERNSITPSDISPSACAEGMVLRKGVSSWGCEALSPSVLSHAVSQNEFDYLDGLTSPIQSQLNSRLSSSGGSLTGALTLSHGSELRLATTNAAISAGFKAPDNMPASTIYTLPSGFGSAGQVLTSSSSGIMSWIDIPVTAINGQTGSVSLNADHINETTNRKYYSHTLARQAISSTGLLSYNSNTGILSLSDTLLTKSGGTLTGSLDFGGTQKVTNLPDPTLASDAARKSYVDSKLGGQPLVVGTPSPGQVVKWDGSKFALASDELGQAGGGIASLNTLTSGSQSLAVETPGVSSGTRPTWIAESATSTHRLSIPLASASGVTAGLISKVDYDVFSGKQDAITPSSATFAGSVVTHLQNGLELRPYGTSPGQTGEVRFRELAAAGTNYVGLKAPDELATNTIWTLPPADGPSGFVLSTNGSGTLSWITPTTGSVTSITTGTGLNGGPITNIGTISLANVGTAGTYTKVTTNAQGQVTSGTTLAETDIPNLSAAKITSGTLPVSLGGTGGATANSARTNLGAAASGANSDITSLSGLTTPLSIAQGGTGSATAQPFTVLAGPGVGPTAGAPGFRALVAGDLPNHSASLITSGILAVAQGGTGVSTSAANTVFAAPSGSSGAPVFRSLVSADIPNLDASKLTSGTLANSLINWSAAPVTTVAGRTGAVTLANTDVSGLGSLATANAVSGGTGGTITDDSITNADIHIGAAIADTKLATIASSGKVANSATTATSAGTANAIVARDGSGNFTAGTITATLNGNATNISGTVAIANGGTGATSASAARSSLGLGTAATFDVGTGANNLVQLDGAGKLPVVDGSQLSGVVKTAGNSTMTGTLTLPSNGLVAGMSQLVLSGGNVGVGTTVPASALDVNGDITVADKIIHGGDTNTSIRFPVADTITVETNGSERMRVTSSGNVGIGITTPSDLLTVAGTANSTTVFANQMQSWVVPAISGVKNNNSAGIAVGSFEGNGNGRGRMDIRVSGAPGSGNSWGSLPDVTVMTMLGNGNVGIGTTSPSATLEINGNLRVTGKYFGSRSGVGFIQPPTWAYTVTGPTSTTIWSGDITVPQDSILDATLGAHWQVNTGGCYVSIGVDDISMAASCSHTNGACYGWAHSYSTLWENLTFTGYAKISAGTHKLSVMVVAFSNTCYINGGRISYKYVPE